jgi:2-polyprenyl-3-methyl-5-hydroxy-6-metoxy-1,4-benzoquinol methylase
LDSETVKLLDVAPQDYLGAKEYFKKSKIFTADIDEASGADFIIDICENNEDVVKSGFFDVVVCTEVLEHTLNPFGAVKEMHRMLKKGGHLLTSTPFDFRIHGPLPDCWRFTEHGLRELLREFDIMEIRSLENKERFLMPLHYLTVSKKK